MFQIVAMQQIPSAITAPAHNDVDHFIAINGDSVFPSTLFGARRSAISSQYLKRHEVCMNWMQHRAAKKATTDETPDLDIAKAGLCINAPRIKGFSIDNPADTRWKSQRRPSSKYECSSPDRLGTSTRCSTLGARNARLWADRDKWFSRSGQTLVSWPG